MSKSVLYINKLQLLALRWDGKLGGRDGSLGEIVPFALLKEAPFALLIAVLAHGARLGGARGGARLEDSLLLTTDTTFGIIHLCVVEINLEGLTDGARTTQCGIGGQAKVRNCTIELLHAAVDNLAIPGVPVPGVLGASGVVTEVAMVGIAVVVVTWVFAVHVGQGLLGSHVKPEVEMVTKLILLGVMRVASLAHAVAEGGNIGLMDGRETEAGPSGSMQLDGRGPALRGYGEDGLIKPSLIKVEPLHLLVEVRYMVVAALHALRSLLDGTRGGTRLHDGLDIAFQTALPVLNTLAEKVHLKILTDGPRTVLRGVAAHAEALELLLNLLRVAVDNFSVLLVKVPGVTHTRLVVGEHTVGGVGGASAGVVFVDVNEGVLSLNIDPHVEVLALLELLRVVVIVVNTIRVDRSVSRMHAREA